MVSGHGRLFTEKSQTVSWCFIINHQLSFTSCSASSSSSLAQFLLFVCNIHFLNKKKLESRGTKDESRERSNLATNRSQPVFLFLMFLVCHRDHDSSLEPFCCLCLLLVQQKNYWQMFLIHSLCMVSHTMWTRKLFIKHGKGKLIWEIK